MKITMYTSKGCSKCMMAKNWFDTQNIPYETVYVDNFDDKQMSDLITKANGAMALPIIFADDKVFSGMDYRKIKELL